MPKRRFKSKAQSKKKKSKSIPSGLGRGYPKSYPAYVSDEGEVHPDFDSMSIPQWWNFHCEFSSWTDEPLKNGDYPLPIPEDFDRSQATYREAAMYGLAFYPECDGLVTGAEREATLEKQEADRLETFKKQEEAERQLRVKAKKEAKRFQNIAKDKPLITQGDD